MKEPVPSLVLSNSLRAAVTGYLRTLANEVAGDGVTVNTVLPGFTATERLEALADATTKRTGATRDAVFAGWVAQTPAGRLGRPEELAATIAFLASDRAGFITGQAILVDGGAVNTLLLYVLLSFSLPSAAWLAFPKPSGSGETAPSSRGPTRRCTC